MRKLFTVLFVAIVFTMTSCSENYSNGERIGLVTQFSKTGRFFKSWEGHLNLTQTGMNSSSSVPFDFSIDNDHDGDSYYQDIIKTIDSAASYGWKIKLIYHETSGYNWFNNRGETDHFIDSVIVLDKDPVGNIFNKPNLQPSDSTTMWRQGRVVDTIYVVIVPKEKVIQ